jgi:hypothetical protein
LDRAELLWFDRDLQAPIKADQLVALAADTLDLATCVAGEVCEVFVTPDYGEHFVHMSPLVEVSDEANRFSQAPRWRNLSVTVSTLEPRQNRLSHCRSLTAAVEN